MIFVFVEVEKNINNVVNSNYITKYWREIFDSAAQIFLNLTVN